MHIGSGSNAGSQTPKYLNMNSDSILSIKMDECVPALPSTSPGSPCGTKHPEDQVWIQLRSNEVYHT